MDLTPERKKFLQDYFGYSEDELALFLENPRNIEVVQQAPELMNTTIVAEVIEATGCNSQHKVGDTFYFDGAGNLLTKLSPKRICIYALSSLAGLIFASNELFYAGVDPNQMRFNRTGCFDVGVRCGGWGHVVMEVSVQKGKKVLKGQADEDADLDK